MPTIDTITAKKLAERLKKLYGSSIRLKEDLFGSTPPSILISEIDYPKVSFGILLAEEEDTDIYDNPLFWSEKEFPIEKILEFRSKLINARKTADVYLPKKKSKIYYEILDSGLSVRSVDVEAKIKKLSFSNNFSKLLAFYGLKGRLDKIKVVDNPKIPKIVDSLIEDDVKTEKAVWELYKKGFSDYYISRILSLGVFGIKINRKLVPSRWAITATQNIILKKLEEKLKNYKSINKIYLFGYKFYGNVFYVLLFPGDLKFELLEAILPGSAYNLHYNFIIFGRDDISGGYYASKLSVFEYLWYLRKKANAIVFRIVTKEYSMPLGVWVVREGVRKALNNILGRFSDIREALLLLNVKLDRYNLNVQKFKKYSNLLKQRTMNLFWKFK